MEAGEILHKKWRGHSPHAPSSMVCPAACFSGGKPEARRHVTISLCSFATGIDPARPAGLVTGSDLPASACALASAAWTINDTQVAPLPPLSRKPAGARPLRAPLFSMPLLTAVEPGLGSTHPCPCLGGTLAQPPGSHQLPFPLSELSSSLETRRRQTGNNAGRNEVAENPVQPWSEQGRGAGVCMGSVLPSLLLHPTHTTRLWKLISR